MASAGSRVGGLETIARELAGGLANRGHDVTMLTGVGPGARLQVRGAPYKVRAVPMFGKASIPARLLARLRGLPPTIIESKTFWAAARHSPSAMRLLASSDVISAHYEVEGVEASRALAVPVVYYYAGPIDPRRLAQGRFKRIVAISRMVADYHATLDPSLGLAPVDAVVAPGVRDDRIAGGPAPLVGASDRPEAIFTGRLDATREKRADKLIEWWPRVLQAAPDARLTLIGGGSDLGRLRGLVERAGLEGSVSLPGPLPHERLFDRLREASLYVFPSSFETFGVAPLEALGAGLPVVASDIPALRESLGDSAILLPPGDDEQWIATLASLLSHPAMRAEWAARGPARARLFAWSAQCRAYEVQLAAAVSGPGSSSSSSEFTPRSSASSV